MNIRRKERQQECCIEGYTHLLLPVTLRPPSDSTKFTPWIFKQRPFTTWYTTQISDNGI